MYSQHNIQIMDSQLMEICGFDQPEREEEEELNIREPAIGKGKCKNGRRRRWKKRSHFEQDLLTRFSQTLDLSAFKSKFAGYTPEDINTFFNKIKDNCIKTRETEVHCRNKLLLWIDRLHNRLSWDQTSKEYKIGRSTGKIFIDDIEKGILKTFEHTNIISFPSEAEKQEMVKILKKRGAHMPHVLFTLDGKHARSVGKFFVERLSWKYHWQPCFNCLFVIERVFGRVCAFNLDAEAKKHDIEILRESNFFQNIDNLLDGWIVLADKGYIGIESPLIAPVINKKGNNNKKKRSKYSETFWKSFNDARNDSERAFGQFFYNKFPLLGNWQGKSKNTFNDWARAVVCSIIFYNSVRMENKQFL